MTENASSIFQCGFHQKKNSTQYALIAMIEKVRIILKYLAPF